MRSGRISDDDAAEVVPFGFYRGNSKIWSGEMTSLDVALTD